MKTEIILNAQGNILNISEKIKSMVNNFGFTIDSGVAKAVRYNLTEYFQSLNEHIIKVNNLLFTESLLKHSPDDQNNHFIKAILDENESLSKRIKTFDTQWHIFEIIKSPLDFNFEFTYLVQKVKNRFEKEKNFFTLVESKINISRN